MMRQLFKPRCLAGVAPRSTAGALAGVSTSCTQKRMNVVPLCRAFSSESATQAMGDFAALGKDGTANYNPEWTPKGMEGGVDTHKLPWMPIPEMPGCSMKPMRISNETGAFSVLIKMEAGAVQPSLVHLGSADAYVLSGELTYPEGPMKGKAGPGVWAYTPSGARMDGITAKVETEYLACFYGPVAFLGPDGKVSSLLTGADVRARANKIGISLLPNTLAAALDPTNAGSKYEGKGDPLAISDPAKCALLNTAVPIATELTNPHFVDTNALPWIVNPDAPDIGLKVMRVSSETGTISMVVRQNGQAPPHYHLGPADFFITSGRIGYRAGPAEGYGPGTYMFEPAGARHEATQRVTDEDLIYVANVYGPIQFDSGVGTPPLMVMSWMQYLEAAKAFNTPLIASTFPNDSATYLASTP